MAASSFSVWCSRMNVLPARAWPCRLASCVPRAQNVRSQNSRRTLATAQNLKQTPLHELHLSYGATMVPFAGFAMPIQYADQSIGDSHRWTRQKASLFDVSHMVQHTLSGSSAVEVLRRMTPASIESLQPSKSLLSCLLHPSGGIVDDLMITRLAPEEFYLVTNAACREKDMAYIHKTVEAVAQDSGSPSNKPVWNTIDDRGLIALQGPLSAEILQANLADTTSPDLAALYFGQSLYVTLRLNPSGTSTPILVSRGGYTGEDGFELSIAAHETQQVARSLLETAGNDQIRLAGLGARDSLRLEAGMCLYGHDLDDNTTPVEAGLAWTIGPERRTAANFPGAETILRQLQPRKEGGGPARKRVGLIVEGAPARQGAAILAPGPTEQVVGAVTSGCPSPSLNKNIAMGYVKTEFAKAGTPLRVQVRGSARPCEVTRMPFVPSKYHRQVTNVK